MPSPCPPGTEAADSTHAAGNSLERHSHQELEGVRRGTPLDALEGAGPCQHPDFSPCRTLNPPPPTLKRDTLLF